MNTPTFLNLDLVLHITGFTMMAGTILADFAINRRVNRFLLSDKQRAVSIMDVAAGFPRLIGIGAALLIVTGFAQSFCMVPMAVILLRTADPAFRGRVMGVRMLAVYGLPLGLLLSGPLIERIGFSLTGSLYSLVGIVFTLLIAAGWRRHLWHPGSPANTR